MQSWKKKDVKETSERIAAIRSIVQISITLMSTAARKACSDTCVAPNSAATVATTPSVGKENAVKPEVFRTERRRNVNGNAALQLVSR